ncbi:MAG: hypothetical protein ABIE42_09520 [Candidatus Eisenbacteria bacterium]
MLAVKVEVWPYGIGEQAPVVGIAQIISDASGDNEVGHYHVLCRTECEVS